MLRPEEAAFKERKWSLRLGALALGAVVGVAAACASPNNTVTNALQINRPKVASTSTCDAYKYDATQSRWPSQPLSEAQLPHKYAPQVANALLTFLPVLYDRNVTKLNFIDLPYALTDSSFDGYTLTATSGSLNVGTMADASTQHLPIAVIAHVVADGQPVQIGLTDACITSSTTVRLPSYGHQ